MLSITGYYAAGELGATYYFNQQLKANPKANHTLIIGPWTDGSIDNGPLPDVRGLAVDPVAQMDLDDLRYQWFDQIFRRGPWPAFIKGRVNVQLAGANDWLHAATAGFIGDRQRALFSGSTEPASSTPPKPARQECPGQWRPATGW